MRDAASLKHAQAMRKDMPEPERKLWLELRAERFCGIKFRRQKVIGSFIADFAANNPKLVIEIDGETHAETENYDRLRTQFFEEQGYRVVRYLNSDVMNNMSGVLRHLEQVIESMTSSPLPTLSPEGERAIHGVTYPVSLEGERANFGAKNSLSPSGERVGERGTQ